MNDEAPSLLTHTPESDLVYYLQDICEFTRTAESNSRMFTYLVFATFGAIQSGMIVTLGKRWIEESGQTSKKKGNPHAKSFIRMFEDLQNHENWEGFEGIGITTSTSWESGVKAVKDLRDSLEHPKYDGTHISCLFIQSDCLKGLDYLRYLIGESPRIRRQFACRHVELKELIGETIARLDALQINQTETLSHLYLDPETPDSSVESLINSVESDGSRALVFQNGIPRGMRIN